MTAKKKKAKANRRPVSRRKGALDEPRIRFVLFYNGNGGGAEAARKAGVSDDRAAITASEWLKETAVQEALEVKYQAALSQISETHKKSVIQVAADCGFTLEAVFKNLMLIIEPPILPRKKKQRAVRDYDKIKAMELGAKICTFLKSGGLPVAPPGSTGSARSGIVEQDGKTFFMYQAEWMRDPDGDDAGLRAPVLTANNG